MRFLVVEYPEVTPVARWTRDHPGACVDFVAEPPQGPPGRRWYGAVMMVRGLAGRKLDEFLAAFESQYGPVQPLPHPAGTDRWLGRARIQESALVDTVTRRVLRFQESFGAPWARVQGGSVYLRARLPEGDDGEGLAARVRAELARLRLHELGLDPQVEVQELDARDRGVWEDLVEHSVGLG